MGKSTNLPSVTQYHSATGGSTAPKPFSMPMQPWQSQIASTQAARQPEQFTAVSVKPDLMKGLGYGMQAALRSIPQAFGRSTPENDAQIAMLRNQMQNTINPQAQANPALNPNVQQAQQSAITSNMLPWQREIFQQQQANRTAMAPPEPVVSQGKPSGKPGFMPAALAPSRQGEVRPLQQAVMQSQLPPAAAQQDRPGMAAALAAALKK